jgi:hypothetical protein
MWTPGRNDTIAGRDGRALVACRPAATAMNIGLHNLDRFCAQATAAATVP